MIHHPDKKLISEALWEVAHRDDGKPHGLRMLGAGSGLEGEDFLTREEALELRDYINKHLGTETTTSPAHQEERN